MSTASGSAVMETQEKFEADADKYASLLRFYRRKLLAAAELTVVDIGMATVAMLNQQRAANNVEAVLLHVVNIIVIAVAAKLSIQALWVRPRLKELRQTLQAYRRNNPTLKTNIILSERGISIPD